jgi:hypothetical protein
MEGETMRTRTRTILAGLVLATALVGSVAWATIPDDNGLYTACKLTALGTIRLIDPSGPSTSLLSHCTSYETKITWNQKGAKGETGAAGASGANGAAGKNGLDGKAGAAGATGADGTDGTNGTDGKDGARGPKGSDGTNGTNGTNGVDGAPGAQGPAGPQGPPGSGSGGLTSLDTLDGIACNAAGTPGAITVTYGPPPAGTVTLACKPTSTPTLTVATTGSGVGTITSSVGGISCGSSCSHDFTFGTVVDLTASSAEDVFTGWSGACSGTGTCSVTMNAAASVTAQFAPGADLTVFMDGGTCGFLLCLTYSINSVPAGISCHYKHGNASSNTPSSRTGTCSHRFPSGFEIVLTSSSTASLAGINTAVAWSGSVCSSVVTVNGETCHFALQTHAHETAFATYP